MARRSKDYIPTALESQKKIDEVKAYMSSPEYKDPFTKFTATYMIPHFSDQPFVETVMANTQNDAIEIVKRNCGMVGWIPQNLTIVEAENS